MKKPKNPVVPMSFGPAVDKLAKRRTGPLVAYYGKHIATVTLNELAESCYVQGARDALVFKGAAK